MEIFGKITSRMTQRRFIGTGGVEERSAARAVLLKDKLLHVHVFCCEIIVMNVAPVNVTKTNCKTLNCVGIDHTFLSEYKALSNDVVEETVETRIQRYCNNGEESFHIRWSTADQRLCFRFSDRTCPLLLTVKISSL